MNKTTVLDGDFETELRLHFSQATQYKALHALHAFLVDPSAVRNTHLAFLRAGAQIIRTNTYRASTDDCRSHLNLLPARYVTLIHGAVKLARQAVAKYVEEMGHDLDSKEYKHIQPLVAGSCGSYLISFLDNISNKWYISLEVMCELSQDEFTRFHKMRMKHLLRANVDLLAFESIPTINEVWAILKLLKKYSQARAWISLLCSVDGKLRDNHEFQYVAEMCYNSLPNQIIAIGAECEKPEIMIPLMQTINLFREPKIPFLLYVDKNNLHIMGNTDASSKASPVRCVQEWMDHGIRYFGGGIHTNAEDIKQICKHVENSNVSSGKASTTFKPRSYQINDLSKL